MKLQRLSGARHEAPGCTQRHTKAHKRMQHHQVVTYMDEAFRRFLLVFEASCLASLDTGSSGGCCSTALPDWAETLHEVAGARPVRLEA